MLTNLVVCGFLTFTYKAMHKAELHLSLDLIAKKMGQK
jgi:hypothetical protein